MENKKYYKNNIVITKLKVNKYLQKQYNANYIITINGDTIDFANTMKEAERISGEE